MIDQQQFAELPLNELVPFERRLLDWARRKREESGSCGVLLEGGKLLGEALVAQLYLEKAWVAESQWNNYVELVAQLIQSGCQTRIINDRLMRAISELDTPPGIIAAAQQPHLPLKKPDDPYRLIVAMFGAQDPGNVGTVIRTADYFGADEVWLDRVCADPYAPKVLRGSMGAFLRIPIFRGDLAARIRRFAEAGALVWAAVAHGDAEPSIPVGGKQILIFGNESRGLGELEIELATRSVKIAGGKRSESLNLSVAAGILIYQALAGGDHPRVVLTRKRP